VLERSDIEALAVLVARELAPLIQSHIEQSLHSKTPVIETPANRKADIDAVVLRFTQRKKRLKNNG